MKAIEFDEEYYEYYGIGPDNFDDLPTDLSEKSPFFCWTCNSTNLEKCNRKDDQFSFSL